MVEDKVIDQDFVKTAMMEAFPCSSSVFILCSSNEPCEFNLQKISATESESRSAAAAENIMKEIYTHLHFFPCICHPFTASIRLEGGVNVSWHAYALRVDCQIF